MVPGGHAVIFTTSTSSPKPTATPSPTWRSSLSGATVFSNLDLKKGYHQIPVHPSNVKKTAIITLFGLFEFLWMPFRLKNAGMTFQCFMDWAWAASPSS